MVEHWAGTCKSPAFSHHVCVCVTEAEAETGAEKTQETNGVIWWSRVEMGRTNVEVPRRKASPHI